MVTRHVSHLARRALRLVDSLRMCSYCSQDGDGLLKLWRSPPDVGLRPEPLPRQAPARFPTTFSWLKPSWRRGWVGLRAAGCARACPGPVSGTPAAAGAGCWVTSGVASVRLDPLSGRGSFLKTLKGRRAGGFLG
ncbi:Hypp7510 [Branchiostoma lanceolatum]|uniref:Hypp7510 protein n=1 Tax=Branchiostoma lanceolatum TaxID=7740 RepID=A0A8K0E9X2_BRALA|nr:Hypp7510 [Branchiostoma lanceolatum]